jgi:hypothetical protein
MTRTIAMARAAAKRPEGRASVPVQIGVCTCRL